MEVLFKKPRKYTLDIPEEKKAKIINTYTDLDGFDWVTWVEFNDESATDSGDLSVTIKTANLLENPKGECPEQIVLFLDDYKKLTGKK